MSCKNQVTKQIYESKLETLIQEKEKLESNTQVATDVEEISRTAKDR